MEHKRFTRFFLLTVALGMLMMMFSACEEEAASPNNSKPSVTIVTPSKGATVYVDTDVLIEASDDKGIARVELWFDHNLDSTDRVFTAPPYEWRISMDSLRDSTVHLLYALAYDIEGNVTRSQFVAFYVRKFLPPQNLSVTYVTKDSLELVWNDPTAYEKGFEIEESNDGMNFSTIQTAKMNAVKSKIFGRFQKTNAYFFRVRGIRDSIYSPYSQIVQVFYGAGGLDLYGGGVFTTAGGLSANRIARWDAERWTAAGSGVNNQVLAMARLNDYLFVGGTFSTFGTTPTNNLARWDGYSWSQAGSGFNGRVFSLLEYHGELYAGGLFTYSGANHVSYVAKWDGSQWIGVGAGFNGGVYALAVYNDELYATGEFTQSGSEPMRHVAKWDGTTWVRLGTGIDGKGFTMAEYNGELYIGGTMREAGGEIVRYITRWNGSIWSQVAEGMDGIVYSLKVFNNELYAGGLFINAGTVKANHIARWNGTSWMTVGSTKGGYGIDDGSVSSYVYTMAEYNGGLYLGGTFNKAGKINTSNIIRWTGSSWEEVGGGTSSTIFSLAVFLGDAWQWSVWP